MAKRAYTMQRRATLEAETRERIVRATVALHAERGGLGTSYAMIAKQADVSPQTVYNHFPELGGCLARAPDMCWTRHPRWAWRRSVRGALPRPG